MVVFGDPLNLLLVLGVVVVLLIWGPQKIPELARGLGRARKEFDDASRGFLQHATESASPAPAVDSLVDTAHKLGIDTQGKTRQEISDEIVRRAQK
ncbi:hypothetical protein AUF62_01630 [archaeon 13_1_20CM_52_20]|nr:MAG: hypothetical protein AUF62_01630 [archaeon 13_1_20CM_52_20]